jgi:hypothetical protein
MTDRLYMASAIIAAIAISVGLIALIKAWADWTIRKAYRDAGVSYRPKRPDLRIVEQYDWAEEDDSPRVTPDRRRQHRPRHLQRDCTR